MSDAPEKIYLQWIPGYPRVDADDEVTWCEDKINDDDVEYVKATATRRLGLLRRCEWVHDTGIDFFFCPECKNNKISGHADGCELAKELRD
ncbi:MAG: hypothetical protein ACYSYU_10550 [Planctomycetota bacterium]|jgi:hypothetical protein